ncbi:MAG: hypothetical protein ABEJ04_07855 [Halobacteriaceae archaeon]
MSDDTGRGPTTKAELEAALDALVLTAYENGVRVDNGGYSLRHADPGLPDWEVTITRTTKLSETDWSPP